MRLLLAAIAVSLPLSSPASAQSVRASDMPVVNPSATQDCPPISRFHAQRQGGKLALKKLNELPPADTYAAAYRRIRGCEVPIIVRYGVNPDPRPQR